MLITRFIERFARALRSFVERLNVFRAGVERLHLELSAALGRDVEFVLTDLHRDPHRNRRHHVREIAKLHRLLVRLPIGLVFRNLFERGPRALNFAVQFSE